MRQLLCPVLIGRRDDLRALDDALEAAQARRGSVVVVSGEAGIGKSRLCKEVAERAAAGGVRVLRGRAIHGEGHVAFRPLTDALRGILRSQSIDDEDRVALTPLLSDRGEPTNAIALADALIRFLSTIGREHAVLIVLEDLHWADADTLAVLDRLADAVADSPVLVVCTERVGQPAGSDVLASIVARRAALRVTLEALSADEIDEMIRSTLETDDLPAALAGAVRARAEGVPFIVEEMLSAYVSAGGRGRRDPEWWLSRRIADALPASYRDLVAARLAMLGDDARSAVATAAVLGRTFDWRLIAPVTGLSTDAVLDALREAARVQLVWGAADERAATFSFRHALARETVLADLVPPEAARVAAAAADVIEDSHPGLPGEWCVRAADLRIQAGDRLGAARLLQEAGRRALARGALATAENALVQASDLVAGDPMAWLGAAELLIEVLAQAGKTERLLELAQNVFSSLGRYLELSGHVIVRARFAELHLNVARAALLSGDLGLAEAQIADARAVAPDAGPDIAARIDALDANVALAGGDADRAAALAEQALRRSDETAVACDALDACAHASLLAGDPDAATAAFERMEQTASRARLPVPRLRARTELGAIAARAHGDLAGLLEARTAAAETGAVSTLARIDLEIGTAHLAAADVDTAAAAIARALQIARRSSLRIVPEVLLMDASRHALGGRRDDMERALGEALAVASGEAWIEAGAHGSARAVLRFARGERDRARAELAQARRILEDATGARAWWFEGLAVLLDAVTDGAAPTIRREAMSDPLVRGYLGYAEAVVRGRGGDAAGAAKAWARADALMPPGWRRHHARVLVGESAVEHTWGAPGDWAAEALAFFEQAGLKGFATHAKAVMRRAGVPVPRRGRSASEVPEDLRALGVTARETEVLKLVALGLSNGEIGSRLFLSPRTVETHVTSLMRKTASESRSQLVAFAASHRA